jgi:BirA family transcriptional regulator, biotin operon repressor / biotin---[acetyl-CoA-carboxylase] ligase
MRLAAQTAFPDFSLRHVARTDSTQNVARKAAIAGAPEGFCCMADEQTAGRGRQGRTWSAPAGSALLASILIRRSPTTTNGLPFAAGIAALDALDATVGVAAQLKWPNDIVLAGRKLGGILCEVEPRASTPVEQAVAVGLGVNLNEAGVPPAMGAISVSEVSSAPTPGELLRAWVEQLGRRLLTLEAQGLPALLETWRLRAAGLGERVRAVGQGEVVAGVATGIDDDGALLITTPSGVRRVIAADVHIAPAQA